VRIHGEPANNVPLFENHGLKASHSGVCKRDNPGRATPHDNNIEMGRQSQDLPIGASNADGPLSVWQVEWTCAPQQKASLSDHHGGAS